MAPMIDRAAERAALARRWVGPGLSPMTEFEMAGAVYRDSLVVGLEALANIDAYDRRGLLNLVAALLEAARAVAADYPPMAVEHQFTPRGKHLAALQRAVGRR